MATPLEIRITKLETRAQRHRELIHTQKATIPRHRAVLQPAQARQFNGRDTFAMACVAPSLADELPELTTADTGDHP